MEIVWSETALETFFKVIDYLFDNWTAKEIEAFEINVDTLLERLTSFNQMPGIKNSATGNVLLTSIIHWCTILKTTFYTLLLLLITEVIIRIDYLINKKRQAL